MPSMKRMLYDAEILQQQADDLYGQARDIVVLTVATYVVVTLVVVFVVLALLSRVNAQFPMGGPLLVSALIAAGLGVSHGRAKAFHLKMEAQTLLCQRQIEMSTRLIELNTRPRNPVTLRRCLRAAAVTSGAA